METLSAKDLFILAAATYIYVADRNSKSGSRTEASLSDAILTAHQIYDKFIEEESLVRKRSDLENTLLCQLDESSMRLLTATHYNEISTLGELANMTEREFFSLRRVGKKTFDEAVALLSKYGLSFKETPKVK